MGIRDRFGHANDRHIFKMFDTTSHVVDSILERPVAGIEQISHDEAKFIISEWLNGSNTL